MCFKFKHFTHNIMIHIDIILYLYSYTIDDSDYIYVLHMRRYTIHNNSTNRQLINFVSTTPLALEIIIPIEFARRLSSFVYFVLL